MFNNVPDYVEMAGIIIKGARNQNTKRRTAIPSANSIRPVARRRKGGGSAGFTSCTPTLTEHMPRHPCQFPTM